MKMLLRDIEAFCTRNRIAETVVAFELGNDLAFCWHLRRGREISPHVEARVRAGLDEAEAVANKLRKQDAA